DGRAHRWSTTYFASLPAPPTSIEEKAYWNESPTKYSPGEDGTTPRSSSGQPSSPVTGRSIQEKSWRKPVHQTTFATSRTRPPSSIGRPSTTPSVRAGTISTPAPARAARLYLISGPPCALTSARSLRPIGVLSVMTCLPRKKKIGQITLAEEVSIWNGSSPWILPLSTVEWPALATS